MPPLLTHLLTQIQSGTIVYPFVLLYGPWVDTHRQSVRESCQAALGFFAYHDILDIRDYGRELGKRHSIKIEMKENDDTKTLRNDYNYEDKGVREINDRLAHAPMGETKIVLLEHLERADIAQSNALLKTCEEPLPHRLIIASTTNKDMILPTLLSRALLIYCDQEYRRPQLTDDQQERWGSYLSLNTQSPIERIATIHKLSATIAKSNDADTFLDCLLHHSYESWNYERIPDIIKTHRMIDANVSKEHSLYSLLLENERMKEWRIER